MPFATKSKSMPKPSLQTFARSTRRAVAALARKVAKVAVALKSRRAARDNDEDEDEDAFLAPASGADAAALRGKIVYCPALKMDVWVNDADSDADADAETASTGSPMSTTTNIDVAPYPFALEASAIAFVLGEDEAEDADLELDVDFGLDATVLAQTVLFSRGRVPGLELSLSGLAEESSVDAADVAEAEAAEAASFASSTETGSVSQSQSQSVAETPTKPTAAPAIRYTRDPMTAMMLSGEDEVWVYVPLGTPFPSEVRAETTFEFELESKREAETVARAPAPRVACSAASPLVAPKLKCEVETDSVTADALARARAGLKKTTPRPSVEARAVPEREREREVRAALEAIRVATRAGEESRVEDASEMSFLVDAAEEKENAVTRPATKVAAKAVERACAMDLGGAMRSCAMLDAVAAMRRDEPSRVEEEWA